MGHRELKRVPMDFKWPLDKVWKGYLNPHPGAKRCPACDAGGYNEATKQLEDDFYDNKNFGRTWYYNYGVSPNGEAATRPPWMIQGTTKRWENNLTQDEVRMLWEKGRIDGDTCPTAEYINEVYRHGIGHDAINCWYLVNYRAKRLGIWGKCSKCKGRGTLKQSRKAKKRVKNWKPKDPRTGAGFQLWETVTEGSPQSPVFETVEKLAEWCVDNATVFADIKASKEEWLKVLREDSDAIGSMVLAIGGKLDIGARVLKE